MGNGWGVGDLIENRWEIMEIRGGGMGIVYIVRDHEWGIRLAAKGFQDAIFARDPRVADRFRREAEVWIGLESHPNIVQAILVKDVHGRPMIFLEYVEEDLAKWISSDIKTHDIRQILEFAIDLCDGMTYAYSKGLRAHRDLKPANCLITSAMTLKVTDFGLASIWDAAESERENGDQPPSASTADITRAHLTSTGVGLGTLAYMAPEQFVDARGVDARADVYAFGIMLYEMLTGQLPFQGGDAVEWFRLHSSSTIPALPDPIPRKLDKLVQRCTSKNPLERFADFDDVRLWLASVYEDLANEAAPPKAIARSLDSAQWRRKGIGLADLGRLSEALRCFDEAMECGASDSATWQCKGVILARLGQKAEAVKYTERAIEIDPTSAKAWGSRAVDLLDLGDNEKSLGSAEKACTLDPNDWTLWVIKAAVLNRSEKYRDALDSADHALNIYKHSDTAWTQRGEALRALGRLDEASACFDQAITSNANNVQALRQKAEIFVDSGKCEEAIPLLDKALSMDQSLWSLWWDKGVALSRLKRPSEQQLICFDKCLELLPEFPHAWYEKGAVLADLGRRQEASECFDQALKLDPKYKDALKGKATVLRELGHPARALEYHERLITLDPDDATAWNDKGATLCAMGDIKQAHSCFERALQLEPTHELAKLNKAVLEGIN